MVTEWYRYLVDLKDRLRLDPSPEREIVNELATHVEDRFQELKEDGLSDEEAAKQSVGLLGSAKLLARQIYEAHSQGIR